MHPSFLALLALVVGSLAHDACISACRPLHEACCRDQGAPECHLFGSCDFEVTPSADPAACAARAQSDCEFPFRLPEYWACVD
ncbi:hypothetical protein ESCO_000612 [Escovopsis weberi]|uniref:Extracellular membrane protein CFEM domain-containing protein n=1 Tax=Escovopsis weberi TaxID=150374 RepID=A0A0M8MUQ0_ESCWE|nr:hypothetical protein ESCO_000612 [Escovopsis weberi]